MDSTSKNVTIIKIDPWSIIKIVLIFLALWFLYVIRDVILIMVVALFFPQLSAGMAAYERILEILDSEPNVKQNSQAFNIDKLKGEVVFYFDTSLCYANLRESKRGHLMTYKSGEWEDLIVQEYRKMVMGDLEDKFDIGGDE